MAKVNSGIGILYVDDEEQSLKYFKEMFGDIGPIYTAASAGEGINVFKAHLGEIGIVVSDNRMPRVSGIEFLEKIRVIDDQPLRILVTAYADLNKAVEVLNDGLLYSYFTKPWDPKELEGRLKKAMDRFWITREKNRLLRDRAGAFREMMMLERATSMGTLSSGLNHHMRNALTVIQAFFDMIPMQLKEEIDGPPKDQFFWTDYYRNVEEQIARMISILSSLEKGTGGSDLENIVLKIQGGIDLSALLKMAGEEVFQNYSAIDFSIKQEKGTKPVSGDLERIYRLLFNVVTEAQKNIGDKGAVEVRLSPAKLEASGAEAVRVQCIDNGPSIPDGERQRLFDPFFVRSARPAELGTDLLACYITVFQHGGTIQAEKLEDDRNMIEFLLPAKPSPPLGAGITLQEIGEMNHKCN